jgi:hypothetical protein
MKKVKKLHGFKILDKRKNDVGNILQAIVEDVFEADMMSPKRILINVDARRMFAMVLRGMENPYTFGRIGGYLRKDHSTILHYVKTSKDLLQTDVDFKSKYKEVQKRFESDLSELKINLKVKDLMTKGLQEDSYHGDICRLSEHVKFLKSEIEALKNNANVEVSVIQSKLDRELSVLQGKIDRRDTELKKYNVRYSDLYKTITNRTKAGTEDLIQRKLNTLFNGVYSEEIVCY